MSSPPKETVKVSNESQDKAHRPHPETQRRINPLSNSQGPSPGSPSALAAREPNKTNGTPTIAHCTPHRQETTVTYVTLPLTRENTTPHHTTSRLTTCCVYPPGVCVSGSESVLPQWSRPLVAHDVAHGMAFGHMVHTPIALFTRIVSAGSMCAHLCTIFRMCTVVPEQLRRFFER